jgi:hypothetical protein
MTTLPDPDGPDPRLPDEPLEPEPEGESGPQ